MILRLVVTLLCGVGLYSALFMLNKTRRAQRGEIHGPSVVKTPRAVLLGVPNALLGTIYYPALAIGIWFVHGGPAGIAVLATVLFAAATSLVLAYSLIFVTRRPCAFCWASHLVNWALSVLVGVFLWRPS